MNIYAFNIYLIQNILSEYNSNRMPTFELNTFQAIRSILFAMPLRAFELHSERMRVANKDSMFKIWLMHIGDSRVDIYVFRLYFIRFHSCFIQSLILWSTQCAHKRIFGTIVSVFFYENAKEINWKMITCRSMQLTIDTLSLWLGIQLLETVYVISLNW